MEEEEEEKEEEGGGRRRDGGTDSVVTTTVSEKKVSLEFRVRFFESLFGQTHSKDNLKHSMDQWRKFTFVLGVSRSQSSGSRAHDDDEFNEKG